MRNNIKDNLKDMDDASNIIALYRNDRLTLIEKLVDNGFCPYCIAGTKPEDEGCDECQDSGYYNS